MKKQSEKDIAERTNVSVSKVDEILYDIYSKTILRHSKLLLLMNFDKFKATKYIKEKNNFYNC